MRTARICTFVTIVAVVAGSAADGATPHALSSSVPLDVLLPASDTLAWPAPRAFRHKRTIETTRDSAASTVTTSVVIDNGRYLFWMQRPRVSLAVVRPDSLAAGSWPDTVLVEFQTKSPQYTSTNVLTLAARGGPTLSAPATTSLVRQRAFVTEHTLTFALPLVDFLRIVHGDGIALEVGGVKVRLGKEQLEALRDFAVRVHNSEPGGA